MGKNESRFDAEHWLPASLFAEITQIRITDPGLVQRKAKSRKRRGELSVDGKLVVLAADHPGRGVTKVGDDPVGMGNRHDYLARILRVLSQPGIDGVMSTPDILEELLIVRYLLGDRGQGLLDQKLLIGCMNRGGIAGASFEMRDRFSAYTAAALQKMRLDGAKMMFRLDLEDPASGSTIQDCALALRELEALGLPAFLEPLPVRRSDGRYQVQKTPREMITVIGIATALGNSSRLLWLKIPYTQDYSAVVAATTCPILMLGGESRGDVESLLHDFSSGLAAGPNVRGLLVGRNILYPGDKDPGAMAAAVASLVHGGASPAQAATILDQPVS